MKKIYIILVIIVIIAGIVIGINIKDDNTKETISENHENKNEQENSNIENKTINNNIENKQEEIKNIVENDVTNNTEEIPEQKEEETLPKTDLEKAIDIVKKDWGEDSSVYFAQDGQTQTGEYIICVRDAQTTNALAWYTVNVDTGEFEKE